MLEINLDSPIDLVQAVTRIKALRTIVDHTVVEADNPGYATTHIQFLDVDGSVLRTVFLEFTKTELDAWNDDDNYLLQQAYAKLQAQGLL